MRIIEFRFWTGNDFCGPYDLSDKSIGYFSQAGYIPEQFTGLLDKNGIKIFEGDIVDHRYGQQVVEWHEESAGFIPFCGDIHVPIANESWVIGNIHQNPELLK